MSDKKPSIKIDKESEKRQKEANELNQGNEEFGGQEGPDPTRYGDWEKGGRCTDF